MYNIALIYPLKQRKFYVNPFYIQKIYTTIVEEKFSDLVSAKIIDVNIEQNYQLLCSNYYQLVIIDTPEGSPITLEKILNEIDTNTVMLIGDTVKYGKSKELLLYLKNKYSFSFYGCLDDFAIIDYINLMLTKSSVDSVSGLMHFKENEFVQNKVRKNHSYVENKKIQLLFTDEIIKAYEEEGIQIFIDGLSRGCENRCVFCKLNNNTTIKNIVHFSQIDVAKTISYLNKKCSKELFIQFTDENFFGGGKKRLKQIIKLSHDLKNINFNGALGIDTRLDTFYTSKKMLQLISFAKKHGTIYITTVYDIAF